MQSSWKDAFRYAWGVLAGVIDEGSSKTYRALFFLLFIAGIAWAVFNYIKMQEMGTSKFYAPSASRTTLQQDRERLKKMIEQVSSVSSKRSSSSVWAQSMRDMNKYTFDDPTKARPDGDTPFLPDVPQEPVIEVVVEPPPSITVKAIMVMGKTRAAVMDIAGVGKGLIVRAGDTFGNRKGRIVRIDSDKVVVRWDGKNWNIAPGF